jgi:hypothetical protein
MRHDKRWRAHARATGTFSENNKNPFFFVQGWDVMLDSQPPKSPVVYLATTTSSYRDTNWTAYLFFPAWLLGFYFSGTDMGKGG